MTPQRRDLVFHPGAIVANRYRILRPLGRGGMGQVYEAEDLELHERVALKTLLSEIAADSGMIARFKREIQLSRKIGHAHVCRVFDLARHPADGRAPDGVLFLTMEFLAGETLAERLSREGRIAPAEALALLAQMAEALDAAHRAGIVHRDFKPSNVMLIPGDRGAVVTDFGLAREIAASGDSTETAAGNLLGTIDYMAPELFTGAPATPASDIYALALVAYQMVTGALPFEGSTPLAGIIRRAGESAPSARSRVPGLEPDWDRAFARGLDPDPSRRFQTCGQFLDTARGASPVATPRLPALTRRRIAAAASGAMLLIASPFAWQSWKHSRARLSPEAQALYNQGVADLHAGAWFAASKVLGQAAANAPHFALTYARLAEAWMGLDQMDKAKQEMLEARRQDPGALSRLERIEVDAIDYTTTRDFVQAARKYEQAASIAGPDAAQLYVDLARAYENAGQPDKAVDTYRKAAGKAANPAAAWLRLGVLFSRQGDARAAEQAFGKAEALYQQSNNLEGLTELALQRGISATARDQFQASDAYLRRALETARLAGNIHQEVLIKLRLSTNAYASGDAATAEREAGEALEAARLHRIDSLAVRGLINLGAALMRKRDAAGAEQHFREGLAMAEAANNQWLAALSRAWLASLYDSTGRSAQAGQEAASALAFYRSNRYAKESFQCLTILARQRVRAEDYKGALDLFQEASAEAAKVQDANLAAQAEESSGLTLEAQERYPQALAHYERMLQLATSDERRGYANLNRGQNLWRIGRYSDAEEAFRAVDAVAPKFPSLRISLLRARAAMALSREQYPEARDLANQALEAEAGRNTGLHAELLGILGLALVHSGTASRGLQLCLESLERATSLGQKPEIVRARYARADSLMATGSRAGAVTLLHDSLPDAEGYPESRLRALALLAGADSQFVPLAQQARDALERLWGKDIFGQYRARADVARLLRSVSHPVESVHP
ncbi:MAG TPA: protein kinase [Bryobacteraceae bacterium]|nr:protein kinase [Bryobacteraceae bacterium]